jgi:hypothetical protein
VNLAAAQPDTLARLRGWLEGLLAERAQTSLARDGMTIDADMLERLRSLGYIN